VSLDRYSGDWRQLRRRHSPNREVLSPARKAGEKHVWACESTLGDCNVRVGDGGVHAGDSGRHTSLRVNGLVRYVQFDGSVSQQGVVLMRSPAASRFDGQIDSHGTLRGRMTSICSSQLIWQKKSE